MESTASNPLVCDTAEPKLILAEPIISPQRIKFNDTHIWWRLKQVIHFIVRASIDLPQRGGRHAST